MKYECNSFRGASCDSCNLRVTSYNSRALPGNFGKMTFQRNWEKCKCVITLLMCKAYSHCRWVWDPWGSVNKDQRIAIMNIPHLGNKFKQKHTSENLCKYETLKNKCANLLKKTRKDYFVKINVKNNRSRN